MTVSGLLTTLQAVSVGGTLTKWALWSWSKAPTGDYGVIEEDNDDDFLADGKHSEKCGVAWVHYFTRIATGAPKTAIETALEGTEQPWRLNTVQYEEQTGLVHYEWKVSLLG